MTLVEVLATLLLSSLVIMLIWTTVAISMKYNIVESKKLQMQQDANYMITDIQRIHRKYDCYKITEKDSGSWEVQDCENGKVISVYTSSIYKYKVDGPVNKIYTKDEPPLNGSYYPSYDLSIKVSDLTKEKPFVEIETTISRIDEGKN